jgi:anti-sigma B factor antagonist
MPEPSAPGRPWAAPIPERRHPAEAIGGHEDAGTHPAIRSRPVQYGDIRGRPPVSADMTGSAVTYSAGRYASFGLPPIDAGRYVIATVRGDLGIASAPALREQIRSLLRATSHLIVDLSAVERAEPSGLAILVGGGRHARLLGGCLRLAAPSPEVIRVLSATGMDRHFDIFPTVPAAIAGQPGLAAPVLQSARVPAYGHCIDGGIADGAASNTSVASPGAR